MSYSDRCQSVLFFPRITESISMIVGTKHPWVKGIHLCSNEGPHPFLNKVNDENIFTKFQNLLKNNWLTKPGTTNSLVKGIQVCPNEGSLPFLKDNYIIAILHERNLNFSTQPTKSVRIH